MSRIGKAPIDVPSGVDIQISGSSLTVKGPKGELTRVLVEQVSVRQEGATLLVERKDDERESRAMHELDIVGVGYRAAAKGSDGLELALGFSHPVLVSAPQGISFVVPVPTRIEVHGIDKQLVGQVAADIRAWRKPEPYKGKGVRYVGEHVRRKAGKAGK